MSKREYGQGNNPLKMVLYIIAVAALCACLVYLVRQSAEKNQEYQEKVRQAAAGETEFIMQQEETEIADTQENGTEQEKKGATEAVGETTDGTETTGSTEASDVSDAGNRDAEILVLNGTGREGVAGYWKQQLENAGYTNVESASYTKAVGEETVIYAEEKSEGESLKEQFPDAKIEEGTVEEGLEAAEGSALPEHVDVYVIIGSKDARNE